MGLSAAPSIGLAATCIGIVVGIRPAAAIGRAVVAGCGRRPEAGPGQAIAVAPDSGISAAIAAEPADPRALEAVARKPPPCRGTRASAATLVKIRATKAVDAIRRANIIVSPRRRAAGTDELASVGAS